MARRHNFQNFSWFYDLHTRDLLDLDPPYQRRSVWNQSFKNYFIDTVLLSYPSPAIFLYEDISEDGRTHYHVVDGKQRLTTLLEFVQDKFPISDDSKLARFRGQYFGGLDGETKKLVWSYQFLVEYIPTDDENVIDEIFDRLNRNVAKLSAQELRHARFDGVFMTAVEELSQWMEKELPKNFPRIAAQSRRQMKDVELVGLILLLLEEGPKGYSQSALDEAYSNRDEDWEARDVVEGKFRATVFALKEILAQQGAEPLANSRLRNQADFYSLFGALSSLRDEHNVPPAAQAAARLAEFLERVDNDEARASDASLAEYYEAARSASNDRGPREARIKFMKNLLSRN